MSSRRFTVNDHAARMSRAAEQATAVGLAGLLVAPGPDLAYFTGRGPAMLVPRLERPDAQAATGAGALELRDWADGTDPYVAAAALLDPAGRYGSGSKTSSRLPRRRGAGSTTPTTGSVW